MAPTPAAAGVPSWVEKWLWNPVERTARGVEAFAAGDPAAAVELLETARRLEPSSPLAAYNVGTARFAAGIPDPPADRPPALLESAARGAGPALAPRAWYNLGTARLAAGDLEEAIEALEEALRRAPGMADAKYNLELAHRELARRRQGERPGEGEPEDGEPQEGEPRDGEPQQDGEPQGEKQEPQEPEGEEPRDQGSREQDSQESQGSPGQEPQRPLPRFRDLPDMTAEEAAAILQAIENLEREQRRRSALEKAPASAGRGKDW